jgi:hypothetical protein
MFQALTLLVAILTGLGHAPAQNGMNNFARIIARTNYLTR